MAERKLTIRDDAEAAKAYAHLDELSARHGEVDRDTREVEAALTAAASSDADADAVALLQDSSVALLAPAVKATREELGRLRRERNVVHRAVEMQKRICEQISVVASQRLIAKHGLKAKYQAALQKIVDAARALEAACISERGLFNEIEQIQNAPAYVPGQPWISRPGNEVKDPSSRLGHFVNECRSAGYDLK